MIILIILKYNKKNIYIKINNKYFIFLEIRSHEFLAPSLPTINAIYEIMKMEYTIKTLCSPSYAPFLSHSDIWHTKSSKSFFFILLFTSLCNTPKGSNPYKPKKQ